MGKMVSMTSQPCCAIGGKSLDTYSLRMVGEGLIYWKRLCQRVRCPNCNTDLAAGSKVTHRKVQHGVGQGYLIETPPIG